MHKPDIVTPAGVPTALQGANIPRMVPAGDQGSYVPENGGTAETVAEGDRQGGRRKLCM